MKEVGCGATLWLQPLAKTQGMIGDMIEKLENEQGGSDCRSGSKVQLVVGVEKMMAFSMTCFA